MQTNPKVTQIAVPALGAPPVLISMTKMASKVEVMEDPSVNQGAAQGLQGYYMDTQPAISPPARSPNSLMTWLPNTAGQTGRAYQPILFGGDPGRVHGGEGLYVGAQGTPLLQLTSNSPTPTQVLLVEYD